MWNYRVHLDVVGIESLKRFNENAMKKVAYRIETPRFILRCWDPIDATLLKSAIDNSLDHLKPWMAWANDEPEPYSKKVDRIRAMRSKFDGDEDYTYGIFTPDETRVIGSSGLHKRGGPDQLEIGYWIGADFIGQGFATEISSVLTQIGFEINGVKRIEIRCSDHNKRSSRIPEKLGYTHEASLRDVAVETEGTRSKTLVWAMFAEEFNPKKQRVSFKAFGADDHLLKTYDAESLKN